MSRRKKSLSGVQVFLGSTVILFTAVFFLSKLPIHLNIFADVPGGKSPKPADTAVSESLPVESGEDIPDDEYFPEETSPEDAEVIDMYGGEDESDVGGSAAPLPDPDDADNTWAMFLVNAKNSVSREYCEGIETDLVFENWRPYYMDSRMAEYMKQMIRDAEEDGIQLTVMSAYRSFEKQEQIFEDSVQDRIDRLGMTEEEARADALLEVQRPGCSEHNSGVAADIMSDEYYSMDDDGFKNTRAYAWLQENAYKYGFILRYPEDGYDSTRIGYEPWHYRFVGLYYARVITEKGITLEQFFDEMNWTDSEGNAVYHIPVA